MKNIALAVLSGMVTAGFFAILGYLLYLGPEWKDAVSLMVGALIGSFTGVVGYWFGSSIGSARKTEIMAKEVIK